MSVTRNGVISIVSGRAWRGRLAEEERERVTGRRRGCGGGLGADSWVTLARALTSRRLYASLLPPAAPWATSTAVTTSTSTTTTTMAAGGGSAAGAARAVCTGAPTAHPRPTRLCRCRYRERVPIASYHCDCQCLRHPHHSATTTGLRTLYGRCRPCARCITPPRTPSADVERACTGRRGTIGRGHRQREG